MTRKRQENVKSIVKNRKFFPIRLHCCYGKGFREAMVVFDLKQTHMVRGITIAKLEKWTLNYKRNSDDLLTWLSKGREARGEFEWRDPCSAYHWLAQVQGGYRFAFRYGLLVAALLQREADHSAGPSGAGVPKLSPGQAKIRSRGASGSTSCAFHPSKP